MTFQTRAIEAQYLHNTSSDLDRWTSACLPPLRNNPSRTQPETRACYTSIFPHKTRKQQKTQEKNQKPRAPTCGQKPSNLTASTQTCQPLSGAPCPSSARNTKTKPGKKPQPPPPPSRPCLGSEFAESRRAVVPCACMLPHVGKNYDPFPQPSIYLSWPQQAGGGHAHRHGATERDGESAHPFVRA